MEVSLHRDELERYRVEGRMAPLPHRVQGIIDTAAQLTCIRARTADSLLLEPVEHTTLHTASGGSQSAVYYLTVQLGAGQERPPDPISVRAYAAPEVLGAEMLIGLDVLRLGELVLFGPDGRYELFLPWGANRLR